MGSEYNAILTAMTVLKFLRRKPRDRYAVAEHLRVHPRSALRLLQQLVAYGLITKIPGEPRTTYRAAVVLTQRR